jgi:CRP/FNR family nitrogen fixation transcriptional regulator
MREKLMLIQAKNLSYDGHGAGYPAHKKAGESFAREARSFGSSLELMGMKLPFARNVEIYGQDEPAGYVYKVLSGAVRTSKFLDDGRRLIGSFYLPGDIFGLESGTIHRFSAEAITDVTVLAIKHSTLAALAQTDAVVARELWQLTARELDHVHKQMLLLGRSNAQERVASFLTEMSGRSPDPSEFDLPMSRQDIADYLGLTIETVSRAFSSMERKSVIELPSSRKVRLKNRTALRSLNS